MYNTFVSVMPPSVLRRKIAVLLLLLALSVATLVWQHWNYASYYSRRMQRMQGPVTEQVVKYNALGDAMLQAYLVSEKGKLMNKAVITILANTLGYYKLRESLESLYSNFNHRFGYPVVIFHEADFLHMTKDLQEVGFNKLRNRTSVFFQQIDLGVPEWFIRKFGPPPEYLWTPYCDRNIGYRSMCRFHAKMVYEQPIMRHFDYQWRLDDDSQITANINFDVFSAMKAGGFSYGYYTRNIDTCAHATYNLTADYIKARNITPTFYHRLRKDEIFFNNFEVSNLKIWRSKQYRDYVDYMDSLGGIYTHRWGDAPIKTLALSMFVPYREIYRFSNVSYDHPGVKGAAMTVSLELANTVLMLVCLCWNAAVGVSFC